MAAIAVRNELRPQEGPQTQFLSTPADIAIYGGAAGGGKSFALLLEPTRHYHNGQFNGVIFRRTGVQVRNPGGLWDESEKIYPLIQATPSGMSWTGPSGWNMRFAHLEYEKDKLNWQGAQIPYIGFDELTHFTETQFFYMMSRNRSTSGIPGYIRATTNPDVNSWVRRFIDWWIKGQEYPREERGYPIPERSGVLRWFIRVNDELIWADTPEEIYEKYGRGPEIRPKSVTFIASSVYDNKILMEKDPSYLSNLMALPRVDRLRLLGGNWDVSATAGEMFQRDWFEVVDALPAEPMKCVRYWDRAATRPNPQNPDPDWTRGCKLYRTSKGVFYVADMASLRGTPLEVERLVKNTASQDGWSVPVCFEEDPGSSGKADAQNYARLLAGYDARVRKPTTDKVTRAKPASAQVEAGNVKVIRGPWNEEFFKELENFGEESTGHDDQVDSFSGAFNELCGNPSILDNL